tara:strand:- start:784 stop:999 length:216 start_codon:yes stop_codon:yes gene_type:complete
MFSKRVYLRKEIREESLHKIVSYLDNKLPEEDNPKKIYTALTRLRLGMNSKCHIYVVNSAKKYIEYGKTWS